MNTELIARLNEALRLVDGETRRVVSIDGDSIKMYSHALLDDGEPLLIPFRLPDIPSTPISELARKFAFEVDQYQPPRAIRQHFPENEVDLIAVRSIVEASLRARHLRIDSARLFPPSSDNETIVVRFGSRISSSIGLPLPLDPLIDLARKLEEWLDREIAEVKTDQGPQG